MFDWSHYSEFCGIDGRFEKLPKSFECFSEEDRAIAYSGLLFSILQKENFEKKIKRTSRSSTNLNSKMFFEVLILDLVKDLRHALQANLRPGFQRRTENTSRVRGKLEFGETIRRNAGLVHRHICVFPELNYNDPLLCFLKSASTLVPHWLPTYALKARGTEMLNDLRIIDQLLLRCSPSRDVIRDSLNLLSCQLRYHSKYLPLERGCRALAQLVLGNCLGIGKEMKGTHLPGIILNLNYPFQDLISMGLSLAGSGTFLHDKNAFNKITFDRSQNLRNFMNPDCRGTFFRGSTDFYLICDAKHKIMQEKQRININEEDQEELERRKVYITKHDFYQMISYAQTHDGHRNQQRYYVLCGLISETAPVEGPVVQYLDTITVKFSEKALHVVCLGTRFGSLLWQIGRVLEKKQSPNQIIQRFGVDLLNSLPLSSAVSYLDAA